MKVVVSLLALVALWWVIQIPSVANAVLLFCAAGVNPFTGRSMASSSMVELLSFLLVASIFILFRKEVRRLVQTLRGNHSELAEVIADQTQDTPTNIQLQPTVTFDAAAGATIPLATMQPLPQLADPAHAIAAIRHASTSTERSHTTRDMVAKIRRWWLHAGEPTVVAKAAFVRRSVVALFVQCTAAIHTAWRAFEPHARRFDSWLERTVHKHETTATFVELGREMERLTRSWGRTLRSMRHNEAVSDLLRAFRH
jgi:hypothetical protein